MSKWSVVLTGLVLPLWPEGIPLPALRTFYKVRRQFFANLHLLPITDHHVCSLCDKFMRLALGPLRYRVSAHVREQAGLGLHLHKELARREALEYKYFCYIAQNPSDPKLAILHVEVDKAGYVLFVPSNGRSEPDSAMGFQFYVSVNHTRGAETIYLYPSCLADIGGDCSLPAQVFQLEAERSLRERPEGYNVLLATQDSTTSSNRNRYALGAAALYVLRNVFKDVYMLYSFPQHGQKRAGTSRPPPPPPGSWVVQMLWSGRLSHCTRAMSGAHCHNSWQH